MGLDDDFTAAVNAAFDKPKEQPLPSGPPVQPFENTFHGPEEPPPLPPPSSSSFGPPPTGLPPQPPQQQQPQRDNGKRRKRVRVQDGVEGGVHKQPRKEKKDPSTPEERREVYEKIMRYVDSFPEHNFPEAANLTPMTTFDELTYILQRIQQRVNAKQELQVLQSGLVTSCMALEFGSTLVPGNPVRLNGFGANVSSNIAMFDDALRQLACKYGGKMVISVEAQIGMMLMRLAANTHLTNVTMTNNVSELSSGPEEVRYDHPIVDGPPGQAPGTATGEVGAQPAVEGPPPAP